MQNDRALLQKEQDARTYVRPVFDAEKRAAEEKLAAKAQEKDKKQQALLAAQAAGKAQNAADAAALKKVEADNARALAKQMEEQEPT